MEATFRSDVQDPQLTTPTRWANSIRRTRHVDITFDGTDIVLGGQCRDLATVRGSAQVTGSASFAARLAADHRLLGLDVSEETNRTGVLVGMPVRSGFRVALASLLPEHHAAASPIYVLLDEIPVATLISGYALMYRGALGDHRLDGGAMRSDICSGWASDGYMMVNIRAHGKMPTPIGPPAPHLTPADDPQAWHELDAVPTGGMRRRRLIDVRAGDEVEVFAMFRDSHVGDDGVEAVLHEYSLRAVVDPGSNTLTSCVATPQVLPWNECPSAAASAERLIGVPLGDLRQLVSRDFRGLGTCTHLNDLLRSLGDLDVLVPAAIAASAE